MTRRLAQLRKRRVICRRNHRIGQSLALEQQRLALGTHDSRLDARDPRALKAKKFVAAAPNTRTHHLQTAGDYLLLANGANIVRMQSYDNSRDYFENTLADSLTNRQPFRSGLSIHDIKTNPAQPREIAFLEMPGIGINRLWWTGGRYAYVSAHFDGFTDHILCIVDLQNITKPEIVGRWWMP